MTDAAERYWKEISYLDKLMKDGRLSVAEYNFYREDIEKRLRGWNIDENDPGIVTAKRGDVSQWTRADLDRIDQTKPTSIWATIDYTTLTRDSWPKLGEPSGPEITTRLTKDDFERMNRRLYEENARQYLGEFPRMWRAGQEPPDNSAARRIWKEREGIIVCECDDTDNCFRIINISEKDYYEASGTGGFYRLTHPDCNVGVVNYVLATRTSHWLIWTKTEW